MAAQPRDAPADGLRYYFAAHWRLDVVRPEGAATLFEPPADLGPENAQLVAARRALEHAESIRRDKPRPFAATRILAKAFAAQHLDGDGPHLVTRREVLEWIDAYDARGARVRSRRSSAEP